jgi:hypothetical protein
VKITEPVKVPPMLLKSSRQFAVSEYSPGTIVLLRAAAASLKANAKTILNGLVLEKLAEVLVVIGKSGPSVELKNTCWFCGRPIGPAIRSSKPVELGSEQPPEVMIVGAVMSVPVGGSRFVRVPKPAGTAALAAPPTSNAVPATTATTVPDAGRVKDLFLNTM